MTEKKKRGRPRKIQSAEDAYKAMESEGLATPEEVVKIREIIDKGIKDEDGPSKKMENWPEEWEKMGKVAKLQWLTANRK